MIALGRGIHRWMFREVARLNARPASHNRHVVPDAHDRGHRTPLISGVPVFRTAGMDIRRPWARAWKAGHFTQEEAPEDTWRLIADFSGV